MLVKDQKALDILSLNESEASELIEMADMYRKNFASRVKENEVNTFIQNLKDPTDEDIGKLLEMLTNMGVEQDESELKQNIYIIIDQQKNHKEQLDKLQESLKNISHYPTPEVEELNLLILDIQNKYLKLDDISVDLKTAKKKLKKIKSQKLKFSKQEMQNEMDAFLKNFINPTEEDIMDFIDSLDDRYEIADKKELIDLMMERDKQIQHDQDFISKMIMFERASDNIDSSNLMLKYRSIRNIYGMITENKKLLTWIRDNHYNILEKTADKLRQNTSPDTDATIAIEARLSLEVLKPILKTVDRTAVDNETCPSCKKVVKPDWKLCPECGESLVHEQCSKCEAKLESSWKLCPYCGTNIK
ncbi:MAG: zinc ribbon domain-containing protein [ANME-2 cluster archaeon]|nr:zinc ribbon domain-containing protein [ANME-2 cluster archaeon]